MVDQAVRRRPSRNGIVSQAGAYDSSTQEVETLPSAPTTGHGWCFYGLLMVPASSMHGGSHRAQEAWRNSVSAQCTPTPIKCTAWQGMGCEHGARAIHKRAVRSSPGFSSNELGARHVHKCTTGCRLQARRLQQATMIECTGRLPSAQGPSAPSPALLSLIVRKNGQPH